MIVRRRLPRRLLLAAGVVALAASTMSLGATDTTLRICTTDTAYAVCVRAFPDPEAGLGTDPFAEGLVPSTHFIQFGTPGIPGSSQLWDGLKLLEDRYDRFLRVWRLEDLLDDPEARSAGLWLGGQRVRSPLVLARVTDETVPARDKERFFFGLSLHGIERAGAEGGTRALEDLVTYAFCESLGGLARAQANHACSLQNQVARGRFTEGEGGYPARLLFWDQTSPTFGEVLKRAELYFAYVNPDGWHRGDLPQFGGIGHYQRYNGNGVDPNREWPAVGYTYEPYTPVSEPETRALVRALRERGGDWAGGIDLHGMSTASAFTYTMLPAGQFDYAKNQRIRRVAERTQIDARRRLGWSPLITDGDGPSLGDVPIVGGLAMPGQQWGTVWDTLDYTITGSLGDWIGDPDIGLGGIGMSNEMALSHITNCGVGSCFLPEIEQLHVAGNKGLIFSHIDTTLRTERRAYRLGFDGRLGVLLHDKVIIDDGGRRDPAPRRDPQPDGSGVLVCPGVVTGPALAAVTHCPGEPFEVLGVGDGVHNGGIRIDVGHVGTHSLEDLAASSFSLQRWVVDHGDEGEWVDVAENFTAGQAYFNNSATIAFNDPVPGRYRAYGRPLTPGVYTYAVHFTRAPAEADPGQRPFRATNLDFFDDLRPYLRPGASVTGVRALDIARDPAALDRLDVLVLPDATVAQGGSLNRDERDDARRTLRRWVRDGGVLILADQGVRELKPLLGADDLLATRRTVFAGYVQFRTPDGTVTYDDPLAAGLDAPGAAEGSGNRHQTYEPVPLGFAIGDGFIPSSQHAAPAWTVSPIAFDAEGGRHVGGVGGQTALGEIPLGRGAIRIAGALLPTPSDEHDHRFGLRSYALTYTGWQLFENLIATRP